MVVIDHQLTIGQFNERISYSNLGRIGLTKRTGSVWPNVEDAGFFVVIVVVVTSNKLKNPFNKLTKILTINRFSQSGLYSVYIVVFEQQQQQKLIQRKCISFD